MVLDVIHVDFLDRVLVPPDDNGRFIDVEHQNFFFGGNAFDQIFFDCEVYPGVFVGFIFYKQHNNS
jgi:hypothetical protein